MAAPDMERPPGGGLGECLLRNGAQRGSRYWSMNSPNTITAVVRAIATTYSAWLSQNEGGGPTPVPRRLRHLARRRMLFRPSHQRRWNISFWLRFRLRPERKRRPKPPPLSSPSFTAARLVYSWPRELLAWAANRLSANSGRRSWAMLTNC